jgi:hypothetical protein
MIDFLEKEKTRLIRLEKRTLGQTKKRPDLLGPEEVDFMKSREQDLETRTAQAGRTGNTQTTRLQQSELPGETLYFREYVLNRVQGFPYRKDVAAFEESAPPILTLGRLQLFRDQYTEVGQWQHEFADRCARLEPSSRLAEGT